MRLPSLCPVDSPLWQRVVDDLCQTRAATQRIPHPLPSAPAAHQGPVAQSRVRANLWLRGIKTYRFPWYLTLVRGNHASGNPGQVAGQSHQHRGPGARWLNEHAITAHSATPSTISFPQPPLPLSSGTGAGGSGIIQNRNQKTLVPVE